MSSAGVEQKLCPSVQSGVDTFRSMREESFAVGWQLACATKLWGENGWKSFLLGDLYDREFVSIFISLQNCSYVHLITLLLVIMQL